MTVNEAMDWLESLQEFPHWDRDEDFDAMDILHEALEKQIPKKIVKIKLRPTEWGSPYRCPECEAEQNPVEFFCATEEQECVSWCSDCGQKLDWSE